jgi:hypothetical protein
MEGEKQIAEAVFDVAEELARRRLLSHGHALFSATQSGEGRMEGFNETDAANLQRVKDAMAEKAVGGSVLGGADAAAAAAFAALLDAETRRAELAAKSQGQEKAPESPAAGGSWTESVTARQPNAETALAA